MSYCSDVSVDSYCTGMTSNSSSILDDLAEETRCRARYPDNMSGRVVGQLLRMLIAISGSKVVLEIGMFTGYATLSMAEALPEDGLIYTCEVNPGMITFAQRFFLKSPHGSKIRVLFGKALDTIQSIKEPLDLVFIDGDKKKYPIYFERTLSMLKSGGVIVLDDMLWKGMVLNPSDERSEVIADLNRTIMQSQDVDNVILPVRGGLNIVRKK